MTHAETNYTSNGKTANAIKGGATYGYARVSTREQNLDRQLKALGDFGIDSEMVYADKASGADFERREYRRLLATLKPGDLVVVKSIDRLGRDYGEIQDQWRHITKGVGADVVVLDMPLLDTRARNGGITGEFISDMVLQVLSYVAQVERENARQRQAEGIAAAKARGVRFGRPTAKRPSCYSEVRDSYLAGDISQVTAAGKLGVSPRTFMRWVDAEGSFQHK